MSARPSRPRLLLMLHAAFLNAMEHDSLNLAQSAAYSAMVALFPALIVAAALIALLPHFATLRLDLSAFFGELLPAGVFPLLTSYFVDAPHSNRTTQALVLAAVVSLTGASSVIATLMEGFRRAEDLPNNCWTFAQRRTRAFVLVPLSLLPLLFSTVTVMFGRFITIALGDYLPKALQAAFYRAALGARWTVALAAVVGLTALIYHLGTPKQQGWSRTLPGAVFATAMWFVTTLIFGWYVTRFANYSQVYGSLGVGIALLFWLYIIFLSVLWGAEFNAQFYRHFFCIATQTIEAEAGQAVPHTVDSPNAIG